VSQIPVILKGFWGVPMDVDYHLALDASANAFTNDVFAHSGASANADGEFSHTLAWGGIDSVVDGDGNPVTDAFDATSESGFDWSQPAVEPEPSSIALCGFGAISTIAAYRRRGT